MLYIDPGELFISTLIVAAAIGVVAATLVSFVARRVKNWFRRILTTIEEA